MEENRRCIAVVRIRGQGDVREEVEETLKMLRLNRNCHAALIDSRPSYLGMLKKAENCVTWGEVSKESVLTLLKRRGRARGNKKLNDEYAKRAGYISLDDLAEAIWKLEAKLDDLPEIEPVFRLHPPRKGFRGGVKKNYRIGGALGYRGQAINDVLGKMT